MKKDLITRLNEGPIMCAEGYLFAMERRGYLSAGPFVPEVVLEHPEVVTQLHREFIRAGSDVVQAFTYYCLLYTSPSPRDRIASRMPSSA